jgi:hypothetical protein
MESTVELNDKKGEKNHEHDRIAHGKPQQRLVKLNFWGNDLLRGCSVIQYFEKVKETTQNDIVS